MTLGPLCKLCKQRVIIPPLTPVIGVPLNVQEYAAGFAEMVQHLSKHHADLQDASRLWTAEFAEWWMSEMFTELTGALKDGADTKRIQLLRVLQPKRDSFTYSGSLGDGGLAHHDAIGRIALDAFEYCEMTARAKELERQGVTFADSLIEADIGRNVLVKVGRG